MASPFTSILDAIQGLVDMLLTQHAPAPDPRIQQILDGVTQIQQSLAAIETWLGMPQGTSVLTLSDQATVDAIQGEAAAIKTQSSTVESVVKTQ